MNMKHILPIWLMLASATLSFAQDQHFTQFFASPLTLNPALTGMYEGKYRVSAIYREQWAKVLDAPYQTISAAADFRYPVSRFQRRQRDLFGVGVLFYNDKVREINFSTNQVMVSAAFHKALSASNDQYLSIGIQAGVAQRNINYSQLTFDDQFNGSNGYTDPTDERLPENNFAFGDYHIGLNYSHTPERKTGVYAGVAMHHILQPELSFFYRAQREGEEDERLSSTLFRKYSAYVNLRVPLSEVVQFQPRALLYIQGPHAALNAGFNFRFLANQTTGTAVHLGAWARPVRVEDKFGLDAVVGMIGIEYRQVLFGFSYDAHLSDLSTTRRGQGAFEFSVAYLGEYLDDSVLCPKF